MNEELLIPLTVGSTTMQDEEQCFDFVIYNNRSANLTSPTQSQLQKVHFLKDLVCFVAQISVHDAEKHVRPHFWKLRRIQESKKHKIGWVFHKLKDRWGADTVKALNYDYNAWTKLGKGVTSPTSAMRKLVTSIKLPKSWRSNAKESLKSAALP